MFPSGCAVGNSNFALIQTDNLTKIPSFCSFSIFLLVNRTTVYSFPQTRSLEKTLLRPGIFGLAMTVKSFKIPPVPPFHPYHHWFSESKFHHEVSNVQFSPFSSSFFTLPPGCGIWILKFKSTISFCFLLYFLYF